MTATPFTMMMGGSTFDQSVQPLYIVSKDDIGFYEFSACRYTFVSMLLFFKGDMESLADTFSHGTSQDIDEFIYISVFQCLISQGHSRIYQLTGFQTRVGGSFAGTMYPNKRLKKIHIG